MSLESIGARIREKLAMAGHIKNRVKFDFGSAGVIFIDNTGPSPVLSHEDAEADTTLACSLETFEAFLAGSQSPSIAYMTGKLKIKGSMGVAMKLNAILED